MNILAIGGGGKDQAMDFAHERLDSHNVLVIPSACSNPNAYEKDGKVALAMTSFVELGYTPTLLHEHGQTPTKTQVEHEFGKTDIMYVLGGNTPYMLGNLALHKTDAAIKQAVAAGTWLSGTSAGGLLPFTEAFSCPAKKPESEDWEYVYLKTLGILPVAATMHADQHDPTPQGKREGSRLDYFIETGLGSSTRGIAIPNGATLAIAEGDAQALYKTSETSRITLVQSEHGNTVSSPADDDAALKHFLSEAIHS